MARDLTDVASEPLLYFGAGREGERVSGFSADRFDTQFLGEAYEIGDGWHAELLHDAGPVRLDRALARAQMESYLLVQFAADNMGEHFAFARRKHFVKISQFA